MASQTQTNPTRPTVQPVAQPVAQTAPANAPANSPAPTFSPEQMQAAIAAMSAEQRAALLAAMGIKPPAPDYRPLPAFSVSLTEKSFQHIGRADSNVWFCEVGGQPFLTCDPVYAKELLGSKSVDDDGNETERKNGAAVSFTNAGNWRTSGWFCPRTPKASKAK